MLPLKEYSPSAAVHGFLLCGLFLPGFDSFGTYLFPPS
nr:MAG TPA: hypothetical protein [Caudoviricetes sp.]